MLDSGRVRVDIFLDRALGLEERFQRCLSESHLFQLGFLLALFRLCLVLESLLLGAAIKGVHHGLDVEHFSTKHHPGILERIAPFFDVVSDLLGKILSDWVRQDALSSVSITVSVNRHVLERHHVQVNFLVVLVRLLVVDGVFSHLLGIFLE